MVSLVLVLTKNTLMAHHTDYREAYVEEDIHTLMKLLWEKYNEKLLLTMDSKQRVSRYNNYGLEPMDKPKC